MLRYTLSVSYCFLFVWTSPLQEKLTAYKFNNHVGGRIVNGERAVLGQFPWQVQLLIALENGANACGGVLISDEWIVTAAHCIDTAVIADVYMGTVDYDLAPMLSLADTFVLHDHYNNSTFENDIGLVKLRKPLLLDENTEPIDLSSEPLESGVDITVSGFGDTRDNDYSNQYLYYATVTTIDNDECTQVYGASIVDSMICTDAGDPAKGICLGDAGSPAVVYDEDDNPSLVAIGGFFSGRGCEGGDPSVFTRVAEYVDWIKENAGL